MSVQGGEEGFTGWVALELIAIDEELQTEKSMCQVMEG